MEESINEQTGEYWKTHDRLHRAYTHLCEAIPHPQIPATSNRLESFLSISKKNYCFIAD